MKKLLSFEFWQKFGKALMVVVAVMPFLWVDDQYREIDSINQSGYADVDYNW